MSDAKRQLQNRVVQRSGLLRMLPRDPAERGRTATNLELLFDLVFAVAVGISTAALHERAAGGDLPSAFAAYAMVFFAIWWAWLNFTWFADLFDTDDWLYRLMTVMQMAGSILVAVGARPGILEGDFTWVVVGYVVIRLVTVAQWTRVAVADPALRATALRYAAFIVAVQLLWILRQPLMPAELELPSFLILALVEVAGPLFAIRIRSRRWNGHHLAERFGLFTIILLGESVIGSTAAVVSATTSANAPQLFSVAASGLVILVGMWWFYFAGEAHALLRGPGPNFVFGYGHLVIFTAAGAFPAGIENVTASLAHHAELHGAALQSTLTIPVVVFFVAVWAIVLRRSLPAWASAATFALLAVIALGTFLPYSWLITAMGVAAITAVVEITRVRRLRADA